MAYSISRDRRSHALLERAVPKVLAHDTRLTRNLTMAERARLLDLLQRVGG